MNSQVLILMAQLLVARAQFPVRPERFPTFTNPEFYQFDHYYPFSNDKVKYYQNSQEPLYSSQYYPQNPAYPNRNQIAGQQYYPKLETGITSSRVKNNKYPFENYDFNEPSINPENSWNNKIRYNYPKNNQMDMFTRIPVPKASLQLPTLNSEDNIQFSDNNKISEIKSHGNFHAVTRPPLIQDYSNNYEENQLNGFIPLSSKNSNHSPPPLLKENKLKFNSNNKDIKRKENNHIQKEFIYSPTNSQNRPLNLTPKHSEQFKDNIPNQEFVSRPVVLEEEYYYKPSNSNEKVSSVNNISLIPLKERKKTNIITEAPPIKNIQNYEQTTKIYQLNSSPNNVLTLNETNPSQDNSKWLGFQTVPKNNNTGSIQKPSENLQTLNDNYNISINKGKNNIQYYDVLSQNKNKIIETGLSRNTLDIEQHNNKLITDKIIPLIDETIKANNTHNDKQLEQLVDFRSSNKRNPIIQTKSSSYPFDDTVYYDDDEENSINITNQLQKGIILPQPSNQTQLLSPSKNTLAKESTTLMEAKSNKTLSKIDTKNTLLQSRTNNEINDKIVLNLKENSINKLISPNEENNNLISMADSESTTLGNPITTKSQQNDLQSTIDRNASFINRTESTGLDDTIYYYEYEDNNINTTNYQNQSTTTQKPNIPNQNLKKDSTMLEKINNNSNIKQSHSKINTNTSKILEKTSLMERNTINITNNRNNDLKNLKSNQTLSNQFKPLINRNDTSNKLYKDVGNSSSKQIHLHSSRGTNLNITKSTNHSSLTDSNNTKSVLHSLGDKNSNINTNHSLLAYRNNTKTLLNPLSNSNLNIHHNHFVPNLKNNSKINYHGNQTHNEQNSTASYPVQIQDKIMPVELAYTKDESLNQLSKNFQNTIPITNLDDDLNYNIDTPDNSVDMWTEFLPDKLVNPRNSSKNDTAKGELEGDASDLYNNKENRTLINYDKTNTFSPKELDSSTGNNHLVYKDNFTENIQNDFNNSWQSLNVAQLSPSDENKYRFASLNYNDLIGSIASKN